MDFLFSHVTAVTLDGQMRVLPDAFVGVTDGKISYLSQEPPKEQPREILDATGQILRPGLTTLEQLPGKPVLGVVPMLDVDIDDEDSQRLLRLFNDPAGHDYLRAVGVDEDTIANLSLLGISGIEVLFGNSDEPYAILNCREQRERLFSLLHMLLAEADHSLDGYETVCQDLLEVLLIWLVRSSTLSLQIQKTDTRSENRECAEIKRYIDVNYRENITLDKLADLAHINKYYLAHTFQKEYGVSPITYLSRRRIEESKYLLGNTSHTLAQVSELLGFSSPSYFSQCFRKAEGISPNEYRRQVREGKRPAPPKRR